MLVDATWLDWQPWTQAKPFVALRLRVDGETVTARVPPEVVEGHVMAHGLTSGDAVRVLLQECAEGSSLYTHRCAGLVPHE